MIPRLSLAPCPAGPEGCGAPGEVGADGGVDVARGGPRHHLPGHRQPQENTLLQVIRPPMRRNNTMVR